MRRTASVIVALVVASYVVLQAAGPAIPAPDSVFGFTPGADNKLATYDQTIAYLKKLAAASRAIRLVEAGKTTQGRTMYFALISSPANLAKIDRLREIAQRLAHPQDLTDAEARALAHEGRAFVHIDGGCHATEVAGPQMAPQLAYNLLARAERPGRAGDSRQRRRHAVADDESGRDADGGRVAGEERRHAVPAVGSAAALPGIRRPRQQPRRLHG